MKWYMKNDGDGIVLSSRVRLARNISEYPFTPRLGSEQKAKMISDIRNAFERYGSDRYNYIDITSKSEKERNSMVEEHLISREFALMPDSEKRMFIYDENGNASVMAGEEDHLRIQSIKAGLELESAYAAANNLDNMLSKGLDFAFDEKFGYLTCCPSNTGTGMRASCMLHLPMLSRNNYMKSVIEFCTRLGLTVRGFYGEGSSADGEIYQISNQVTLGLSEDETIKRLLEAVTAISDKEKGMRDKLASSPEKIKDKLWRSYGILRYSRSLSSSDFLSLWSDCMLAKSCDIIPELSGKNMLGLLIECMPSHIIMSDEEAKNSEKRDIIRANRVREFLAE